MRELTHIDQCAVYDPFGNEYLMRVFLSLKLRPAVAMSSAMEFKWSSFNQDEPNSFISFCWTEMTSSMKPLTVPGIYVDWNKHINVSFTPLRNSVTASPVQWHCRVLLRNVTQEYQWLSNLHFLTTGYNFEDMFYILDISLYTCSYYWVTFIHHAPIETFVLPSYEIDWIIWARWLPICMCSPT